MSFIENDIDIMYTYSIKIHDDIFSNSIDTQFENVDELNHFLKVECKNILSFVEPTTQTVNIEEEDLPW